MGLRWFLLTLIALLNNPVADAFSEAKPHVYNVPQGVIHIQRNHVSMTDRTGRLLRMVRENNPVYLSECADFDGDGDPELITISGNGILNEETVVTVYELTPAGPEIADRYTEPQLNIWKTGQARILADEPPMLFAGVYKTTRFSPDYYKRPFFYRYQEGRLQPYFRGSRLSHPFEDVCFCDVDGNGAEEMISVEYIRPGETGIGIYYCIGFGFENIVKTPIPLQGAKRIRAVDDGVTVRTDTGEISLSEETLRKAADPDMVKRETD